MEKIDRTLQLEILKILKDSFPEETDVRNLSLSEKENFQSNLFYLYELGLIQPVAMRSEFSPRIILTAKITARGLDFLEDDGGISAILKTFTVKLDLTSIRALMETKILNSNLPTSQKTTFTEKLKSLPGDVLKTIIIKLIEKGIEDPQLIVRLLERPPI